MSQHMERIRIRLRLKRTLGRRKLAGVAVLGMIMASAVIFGGPASANGGDGTTINWTGQGSDNLPCANGGHWVLTGQGITSAVAYVGNESGDMVQHGQGSFSFDSSGPIDANTVAKAVYQGEANNPQFVLSHCLEGNPPPPPTDVCPNIPGNQSEIPPGMVKDNAGNCVTPPPTDVCPNIEGNQATVPPGMVKDNAGNCVTPPPTDVCPNLPGNQDQVPRGYELDNGVCVVVQPPASLDLCKNLSGNQSEVPAGFVADNHGNCIKQVITKPHPKPKPPQCSSSQTLINGACVTSAVAHTGLGDTTKGVPVWEISFAALVALLLIPGTGLVLKRIRR